MSSRKWNLRYVVEDANNNVNILCWAWLDGMLQDASVNIGYKKTEDKKGLLHQNQESDPEIKSSLKYTSPEHSTSFSCTVMFFIEIRQWLY